MEQASTDYARIEKAIGYIDTHFLEHPDLEALARAVNLSPFHFQRLFTRWAGISPARFVHYLTVNYAQSLLAQSETVLDTALESGLSGPGRLHDLLVSFDALTPGEARRRGEGVEIRWGLHDGPFGRFLLCESPRGITGMAFVDDDGAGALDDQRQRWPAARFVEDRGATADTAAKIFPDRNDEPSAPLRAVAGGTNFQVKVWEALLRVPSGRVVSYSDLARAIGKDGAQRAIGNALSRNPLGFLIPCHRVIRATGVHQGYRWGITRRKAILAWEAARFDAA